ncbi:signal peptidase I [bacterium]|nr:signal peptidase I [bacterium]
MDAAIPRKEMCEFIEATLSSGSVFLLHATGYSMYPFIRNGTRVEILPLNHARLRVGDIVVYRTDRMPLVIHRVIETRSDTIICKGDNLREPDTPVSIDAIVGRVRPGGFAGLLANVPLFNRVVADVSRRTNWIRSGTGFIAGLRRHRRADR